MLSLFETLFNYAANDPNITHWLGSESEIRDYTDSARLAQTQRAALLKTLKGEDRALLERYLDNRDTQSDLDALMLFCQGLSMGLRLGAAALSAS